MAKSGLRLLGAIAAVALAPGCFQEAAAPPGAPDANGGATSALDARIAAVVASPSRPPEDVADDPMRKPAAVLAFLDIQPGVNLFEIESGRGYYTELFSPLVGPEGAIIMQNPESFDTFLGDAIPTRLADDRLANVRYSKSNFDQLDAPDGWADVVTWILGPHELYFTPSDGVTLGEAGPAYAEIFRILKPGGSFFILDHAAAAGAPETTGNALHRIDPAIVKALAAEAGLTLAAESSVLRNPDDDYETGVFDPSVRRKTDRFLLHYRKP
ncbi:MAG: class I SAM-dependent methyltransferase [Hyphococcus sp.]